INVVRTSTSCASSDGMSPAKAGASDAAEAIRHKMKALDRTSRLAKARRTAVRSEIDLMACPKPINQKGLREPDSQEGGKLKIENKARRSLSIHAELLHQHESVARARDIRPIAVE